ncbi:hypothetical protein H310_13223 [Aphanomyces invadans]|uniref:Uncharacterized protein n=1 Tax=Aphanomyces invadans TaxID=157072 RepID=A0A024TEG5_9STRA|nr:hypothetical protein H310_13223 [Aphanomyces invadans]ETV92560.1 hypothetical protein H310_13223 [Aphanomyces invadans]|eukprot:XP_008878867.1 hypothetical protein H310_13223 [Aphanomyces invadans]
MFVETRIPVQVSPTAAMVLLSKLTLPDADKNSKASKTPITQLTSSQCIQWLNPRRQAHGLPTYSSNKPPPVEQLRSEIIDAVQNGTYSHTTIRAYDDDEANHPKPLGARWSRNMPVTRQHLAANQSIPYTDLWTAAFHGRVAEVQYYVRHGLHPDTAEFGYPNQTPLHYAAAGGSAAMVTYLLAMHCSLVAVDANGNTPVHLAARWGRREVIKVMKMETNDGSWTIQNKAGQTPDAIARAHGHEERVGVL